MKKIEVWTEDVKRKDGKAVRVVMTNGAVGITFIEKDGKIIEPPHSRIRLDGATIYGPDSYWMPRAHYIKAYKIAAKILREDRLRKGSKR